MFSKEYLEGMYSFFRNLVAKMHNQEIQVCKDQETLQVVNDFLAMEGFQPVSELHILSAMHLVDHVRSLLTCIDCYDPEYCPVHGMVYKLEQHQGFVGGGAYVCKEYLKCVFQREIHALLETEPKLLEHLERKLKQFGKKSVNDLNHKETKELYDYLHRKYAKVK